MSKHTPYIILLIALSAFSCERVEIIYPEQQAYDEVTIQMDWSNTGLRPDGATVMFYPQDGKSPIKVLMTSDRQNVKLRKGAYSIIAINQSFNDFDNIQFRGLGDYRTIEAYAKPISRPPFSKTTSNLYMLGPDQLAVARLDRFVVNDEMIKACMNRLSGTKSGTDPANIQTVLTIRPQLVTSTAEVYVNTQGVNYIRYSQGVVSGLAGGIMLSSLIPTPGKTAQLFDFDINPQNNDKRLGILSAQTTSFGLPGVSMFNPEYRTITVKSVSTKTAEQNNGPVCILSRTSVPVDLEIIAPLIDNKTTFSAVYNLNAYVDTVDHHIHISISFNNLNIPPVENPSGSNSGFNPDVDDWNNNDKISIPLQFIKKR